jgi:hypothetical protein
VGTEKNKGGTKKTNHDRHKPTLPRGGFMLQVQGK